MNKPPLFRRGSRTIKAAGIAFAALGMVSASIAAATLTAAPGMGFKVYRDGSNIGQHTISFEQKGDDLIVDIEIGLEVNFAFFTLFDYKHRNREVWRNGRLVSINTETDNNGTLHSVSGRAVGNGFLVTSDEEQLLLPADIIPTSYWNPATRSASKLLNSQTGELIEVTITEEETKRVAMPWGESEGRLHRMTGDLELDLWYDPRGCLLKLSFKAPGDGSMIDYKPEYHSAGQPELIAASAESQEALPCKG